MPLNSTLHNYGLKQLTVVQNLQGCAHKNQVREFQSLIYLLQDEPLPRHEPLTAEESKNTREIKDNSITQDRDEASESSDSSSESDEDERPIRIKLPLQLDFDDLAGALMEKNQKSRMNCIVEKKHAEEVVDHQPKTVALPFGVNLTTDPRYERLSGERMAIFCESGNVQRYLICITQR